MPIDPKFKEEGTAYIREQNPLLQKEAEYLKFREKTFKYIRDPRNREEVLGYTRPLLKRVIAEQPYAWESHLPALFDRDSQLRAYLEAPMTRAEGPSAVHVNQLMAEMSVKYTNPRYVGELVAEPFGVTKESNIFAFYNERYTLGYADNTIGPEDDVPELRLPIDKTTHTYQCVGYGFKTRVTPREIANADVPLEPLLDAQMNVTEGNAFRREINTAAFFLDATNFDAANITAVNAGEEWDSATGGNPGKQMHDAVKSVLIGTAAKKVLVFSIDTFLVLARHPALLYTSVYTRGGFLTIEAMKQLFMVDEIYVSEAWKDVANLGQTENRQRMWGDFAVVVGMQQGAGQSLRSYQFAKRFRKGALLNQTLFVPHIGQDGVYYVKETYLEHLAGVAPAAGAQVTNTLS